MCHSDHIIEAFFHYVHNNSAQDPKTVDPVYDAVDPLDDGYEDMNSPQDHEPTQTQKVTVSESLSKKQTACDYEPVTPSHTYII